MCNNKHLDNKDHINLDKHSNFKDKVKSREEVEECLACLIISLGTYLVLIRNLLDPTIIKISEVMLVLDLKETKINNNKMEGHSLWEVHQVKEVKDKVVDHLEILVVSRSLQH